jgi:hypothetical protein
MENILQQLNWVMLLSQRTNSVPSSRRYRTAWRHLLTTISNLQADSPDNLDTKLGAALEQLYYCRQNHDPAGINSLREFASAVEAQSGNRSPKRESDSTC